MTAKAVTAPPKEAAPCAVPGQRNVLVVSAPHMAELLAAAQALAARGFFTPTTCADAATLKDMAAMRAAIAKASRGGS